MVLTVWGPETMVHFATAGVPCVHAQGGFELPDWFVAVVIAAHRAPLVPPGGSEPEGWSSAWSDHGPALHAVQLHGATALAAVYALGGDRAVLALLRAESA